MSESSKSMIRLKRSTKIRLSNNDLNRIMKLFQVQLTEIFFTLSFEKLETMSILNKKYQSIDDSDTDLGVYSSGVNANANANASATNSTGGNSSDYVQEGATTSGATGAKGTKERYIIPLSSRDGWRIHVVVDRSQIEQLRQWVLWSRYGIGSGSSTTEAKKYGNYCNLLVKRNEFVFPVKKESGGQLPEGLPTDSIGASAGGILREEEDDDAAVLRLLAEGASVDGKDQSSTANDSGGGEGKKARNVLKYKRIRIVGQGVNIYVLKRP